MSPLFKVLFTSLLIMFTLHTKPLSCIYFLTVLFSLIYCEKIAPCALLIMMCGVNDSVYRKVNQTTYLLIYLATISINKLVQNRSSNQKGNNRKTQRNKCVKVRFKHNNHSCVLKRHQCKKTELVINNHVHDVTCKMFPCKKVVKSALRQRICPELSNIYHMYAHVRFLFCRNEVVKQYHDEIICVYKSDYKMYYLYI